MRTTPEGGLALGAQPDDRETAPEALGVVAILGLGLIGGSIGMALCAGRSAADVVGWSRSPASREEALARGAVRRVAATPEEAAAAADVVVLGVPVDTVPRLLRQVVPVLRPGAAVTDVGSVKASVMRAAQAILPDRFVGGHPMAGSEQAGVSAARADLLAGATWVLVPGADTCTVALQSVTALVAATGARAVRCDADTHDRAVAALSHVPHLAAYALAATALEHVDAPHRDLAAGSFRDGTRVAASDPSMWTGILMDNRDQVATALDRFDQWLRDARGLLENGDSAGLQRMLEGARDARTAFAARPAGDDAPRT